MDKNPAFSDEMMEAYYRTLPSRVPSFSSEADAAITSVGELRMIGEHFKRKAQADADNPGRNS